MATCESCGRDETDLTKVQRVYLVADDPGPGESREELDTSATPTAGDIEMWCASCAATFPHTPVSTD